MPEELIAETMSTTNLIDELSDRILSRFDPQARPKVERDLARLKELQVGSLEAALAITGDPMRPAEERSLAAWFLGQIGDAGIAPALVDLLEQETSEAVVWEMCKVIATLGASTDRPQLSSRLEAMLDRSPEVRKREALVFALGLLGQQSAIPVLLKVLRASEAPLVLRVQAAEALGNFPGSAAAEALLEGLESYSPALPTAIIRALRANSDSRLVPQLEGFVVDAEVLLNEARTALEEIRSRDPAR
jgi:HEAT repeat protein